MPRKRRVIFVNKERNVIITHDFYVKNKEEAREKAEKMLKTRFFKREVVGFNIL